MQCQSFLPQLSKTAATDVALPICNRGPSHSSRETGFFTQCSTLHCQQTATQVLRSQSQAWLFVGCTAPLRKRNSLPGLCTSPRACEPVNWQGVPATPAPLRAQNMRALHARTAKHATMHSSHRTHTHMHASSPCKRVRVCLRSCRSLAFGFGLWFGDRCRQALGMQLQRII
jgi:hypothetical protein